MKADSIYPVDDESADDTDTDGQKCDENSKCDVPEDYLGPRLPYEAKDWRNIPQRLHSFPPRTACRLR